jgi:hypothetical protein
MELGGELVMWSAVLPLRAPFRRGVPLAVPLVLRVVAAARDRPQPPAPPPPQVAVLAVEPKVVEDQIEFVGEVEDFISRPQPLPE